MSLRFGLISLLIAHQFAASADSEAGGPQTNSPVAASPPAASGGELEHPKEDFQVHLRTNTPPGTIGSTNTATNTEHGFSWNVSWRGWDGLHLALSQTTPLKETPREMLGLTPWTNAPLTLPTLHLEQLKFTANFGALLEEDAAAYHTTGNLDIPNDIALRRARLIAQGDSILLFPFTYRIELGYVPHRFNLNSAWISSEHIDYIGYLVFGVFQPPMGLDLITSSRDLTFMEPASVLQSLAPGNEAGIQIGQPVFNQRGTWALGIFGGGFLASEYGNASQNYGNLIGRVTYLPIDHIAPNRPDENQLLHVGLSANVQYSASSTVRYQSRPESYLAPHLIDTGDIDAGGSGVVAAEAAYVRGPFSAQAEFLDSVVREDTGTLNFYGTYANVSWYLTGESRPYNKQKGAFQRLIPRHNFNFGKDGAWGALQFGARASYTDLTDGDVRGGRMGLLMGEVNWYLHSHVRWMFNAGGGHISDGVNDGHLLIFQTRIGIDF